MMLRRARNLVAGVSVLLAPVPGLGALPASSTLSYDPIQHVIVVMQSGHSFDNYFGTRTGVDGIPADVCEPVIAGSPSCVKPFHLNSDEARSGLSSTLRVTQKAIDGGKMDHFVAAQASSSIGSIAMGYLDRSDLPYYWSLADRFTLFDHFYASSQAGALPNRLVSVAGQDGGLTSNILPFGGLTVPTVFDQLDEARLSWKYYVQGYRGPSRAPTAGETTQAPILGFSSTTGTSSRADQVVNTSQYFTDLAKDQLPAVSYVTSTTDSERAPENPSQGEAFVQSLINALMQSPEWSHTALLLTYDDSGGWYDHSVPPSSGGMQLGLRVPTLLVSPYARSHYVDGSQLDTASIPAFIDNVFHLPMITAEAAAGGSILSAIDSNRHPISPAIAPNPGAVTVAPRPAVVTIYVLYLGALLVAGLIVAFAFRQHRRREPDSLTSSPPPELAA